MQNHPAQLIGVDHAGEKVDHRAAQRIVHHAVQHVAQAVGAVYAIGGLVAGVLPDLAQQRGVRVGLLDGLAHLKHHVHGQLVHHVQPPPARAAAHPAGQHAGFIIQEEITVGGVVLVDGGQRIEAPPAVIPVGEFLKAVPVIIRAFLALIRAQRVIAAIAVEVLAVRAGVAEHAVQQDADAARPGCRHQIIKGGFVAQNGVDFLIAARVVAVIGMRAEDGVEVDDAHTQVRQVIELLPDAPERAAEKVQGAVIAVFRVQVQRGALVPFLMEGGVRMRRGDLAQASFLSVLILIKAVGENLVYDPVTQVFRGLVGGVIDRHLIAVWLAVIARAFAAQLIAAVAVTHVAVCAADDKVIPEKHGLVRYGDGCLIKALPHRNHRIQALRTIPGAQQHLRAFITGKAQRQPVSRRDGPKGIPVLSVM